MVVDPVDNLIDWLVLDGLVEDLMHEPAPLITCLVIGTNGIKPIDVKVWWRNTIRLTMHDECRSGEIRCVDRIVNLSHRHLLNHAHGEVLVVQRIGHVVVNDGLVGAHTITEGVLDPDSS